MGSGAPHFSEEWLEGYRARIGKGAACVRQADGRKGAGGAKKPLPAPSRARSEEEEGFTPYVPGKRVAVPISAYNGKQTEAEKRYNATVLLGRGRFEAVCLYLPGGGRYTPDFMTVDGGVVTFHEVKGSYRLGSQGRALTAFQEAAAAFPMWRFVWATERKGGGFDIKAFDPTTTFGSTNE